MRVFAILFFLYKFLFIYFFFISCVHILKMHSIWVSALLKFIVIFVPSPPIPCKLIAVRIGFLVFTPCYVYFSLVSFLFLFGQIYCAFTFPVALFVFHVSSFRFCLCKFPGICKFSFSSYLQLYYDSPLCIYLFSHFYANSPRYLSNITRSGRVARSRHALDRGGLAGCRRARWCSAARHRDLHAAE